jgi:nitrate/nitrite-specific signal transduction histidine kinase
VRHDRATTRDSERSTARHDRLHVGKKGDGANQTRPINALKHAFTEDRHGKITINYRSEGSNWTLSVSDDGIGMPSGADKAKAGLGTGIVEALARHLEGVISVADAEPGTTVTLFHDEAATSDVPFAA